MKKKFSFFKDNNYHYLKILGIILAAILFFVTISNLGFVSSVLSKIFQVLLPILLGLAMAFITNLPLKFFEETVFKKLTLRNGKVWSKLKRPLCLTLSILLLGSFFVILLSFVVPEFVSTCEKFFINLPTAMDEFNAMLDGWLASMKLEFLLEDIDIDWDSISSWALNTLKQNQNAVTSGALGIVTGLFSTLVNLILAFFFSIYILASKETLGRLAKSFIYSTMKKERAKKLISLFVLSNKAFTGFVSGQCVEVLLIGVLCFVGMLIFGMPYAVMVSCIIAVTAFVPVFGPFVGTAIGAFLILIESPIKALWFVIFIVILQQLESNIIYPSIMGKQVGLPGIWVLAAVTIGGGLFGIVGIIFSVPMFSVIYTLFNKWIKKRLEERNICYRSMSHDSSAPKPLSEDINNYEFEEEYADDFEDDVYTDDGELRDAYNDVAYQRSRENTPIKKIIKNKRDKRAKKKEAAVEHADEASDEELRTDAENATPDTDGAAKAETPENTDNSANSQTKADD